ncbi:FMRFamide-related neuropeptide [Armadillidium nasatum]|uniref:FMRFamide-related neuropeptide n=1 Tax=Armadillidium nasatum TaxID=96803 RepID=A0A5N5TNK6_9CRUS|nr:FMRFamide-related neuropeptide [Armadillidium nasatum]
MRMRCLSLLILKASLLLVFLFMNSPVDAGYRKPPFNGSIFGKHADQEETFETMCRLVLNVCTNWFPEREKK